MHNIELMNARVQELREAGRLAGGRTGAHRDSVRIRVSFRRLTRRGR